MNDREILNLLNPRIQSAIKKKWHQNGKFREVQKQSIPVIVKEKSCLIISPTAGGKTEAALIPLFSNIYNYGFEDQKVQAIYIAPLKALLNDLDNRIIEWTDYLEDLTIFKWHGDVSTSLKKKQINKPATILLSTPESLDVILASNKIDNQNYFSNVHTIIIDEAHYFAKDSRGAQLSSINERIQYFSQHTIQRIGLSATVGDPERVALWLQGSGAIAEIIKTDDIDRELDLKNILIDDTLNKNNDLQSELFDLVKSGKSIIFGNSRRDVEMTARLLNESKIDVLVHHGSISKYLREEAEELMSVSKHSVISATSTLELGIDIGDLNRVVQKGLLPSVNSYLQRIGRAGRKDGKAQIALITDNFEDFVLNLSFASLGMEKYNEPLRPSKKRYDIFFQQLLLEILSNYGISLKSFYEKVKKSYSYQEITYSDIEELIEFWKSENYLQMDKSSFLIGSVIEKRFSSKNYMELYSVFDSNTFFEVFYEQEEIGVIEEWFAFSLIPGESFFQLAGRKWFVNEIFQEDKRVNVLPSKDGLPPNWSGGGMYLIEYKVARRYQDVLERAFDISKVINHNDLETFNLYLKSRGHSVVPEGKIGLLKTGKEYWIQTYAGTMINQVITFILNEAFPNAKIVFNFKQIDISDKNITRDDIILIIRKRFYDIKKMKIDDWLLFLSKHLTNFHYSKFSEYVPDKFSVKYAASSFFILDEFKDFLDKLNLNKVLEEKMLKT